MAEERVHRRLAAILAADVVGYSRLMEADEEGTARSLRGCRQFIDGLIRDHRGRVFGSAGDSVIAEFASPVEAVRCAVEIQLRLGARNDDVPEDRRMNFRIGVNLGDVMIEDDNLLGEGVNVASRLESLADAGGVCLSQPVLDQVKKRLGLGYQYLGKQRVKNIKEPIRAYRVLASPEDAMRKRRRRAAIASVAVAASIIGLIGVVIGAFIGAQKASQYLARVPDAIENRREVRP